MPLPDLTPAGYLLWVAVPDHRWWAPSSPSQATERERLARNAGAGPNDVDPAYVAPVIAWADLGSDRPHPVTPEGIVPIGGGSEGAVWFVHPDRGQAVRQARDYADQANR